MADDEVKKRTVYVLSQKTPDENYDMYVGSTSRTMLERLAEHKSESKRRKNSARIKLYKRMTEVGLEEWKITPLFQNTCAKDEIRKFEKNWLEILDADLNTITPFSKYNVKNREIASIIKKRNVDEKKYFCDVCEKAFQSNWHLNQHKDSLKHQYAYLDTID